MLAGAFIALFAVFFLLKDGRDFFSAFCGLFPAHRQLVILLALTAGGVLAEILGAFLAVP